MKQLFKRKESQSEQMANLKSPKYFPAISQTSAIIKTAAKFSKRFKSPISDNKAVPSLSNKEIKILTYKINMIQKSF